MLHWNSMHEDPAELLRNVDCYGVAALVPFHKAADEGLNSARGFVLPCQVAYTIFLKEIQTGNDVCWLRLFDISWEELLG